MLLLILLFFPSPNNLLFSLYIFSLPTLAVLYLSRLFFWICITLLWLYATKFEKQRLVLWEEQNYGFFTTILSIIAILFVTAGVVMFANLLLKFFGLLKESGSIVKMMKIFSTNKLLAIATAATAGITEEIIFRGYIQTRLQLILKSPSAAIVISSVFFGLTHYAYGTIANVVGPFVIGLVFSIYYSKYRNIKILMVCHFLWDYLIIIGYQKFNHA